MRFELASPFHKKKNLNWIMPYQSDYKSQPTNVIKIYSYSLHFD